MEAGGTILGMESVESSRDGDRKDAIVEKSYVEKNSIKVNVSDPSAVSGCINLTCIFSSIGIWNKQCL